MGREVRRTYRRPVENILQSFVMFIRRVSGVKNVVADWFSRMHVYLATERGVSLLSEGHAEMGCLISCMLEYRGFREPAVKFAVRAEGLVTVGDIT